jgi:hypothetical protein
MRLLACARGIRAALSVQSVTSVITVTDTLAVLALLAAFKHRCGFLEEGQMLTWPSCPPSVSAPAHSIARSPIPAPNLEDDQGKTASSQGCMAPWHLGALTPVLGKRASHPWHLAYMAMLHGVLTILAILTPVLGKRAPRIWLSCSAWLSCLASVLSRRARVLRPRQFPTDHMHDHVGSLVSLQAGTGQTRIRHLAILLGSLVALAVFTPGVGTRMAI